MRGGLTHSRRAAGLLAAACLAAGAGLAPAESLLRGDLRPLVPCIRPGGPIPVEVTLDWAGTGILEGRLVVSLGDGGEVRMRHESADLALTAGRQTFRILLPPVDCSNVGYDQLASADVRFVTPSAAYPIVRGQIPLRMGVLGASTVVAICRERAAGEDGSDVERSLRAEVNVSDTEGYDASILRTYVARWPAEDLPVNPLAYCAIDVLYIAAESMPLLKSRQLEAVAHWVAAGGSVCIGEDAAAPAAARDFTDALAAVAGAPVAGLGSAANGGRPCHLGFGLGRCAIVDGGAAVPDRTRRYLWGFSSSLPGPRTERNPSRRRAPYRRQQQDSECAAALIPALLPRGVQPVPLGTLSLVLLGLLVAVGPLDYWALGRLRLRRLTWILFPALVAVTTVGVVQLANLHLGRRHRTRTMTVVDVGADGRALRSHTFAVVFAGRTGHVGFTCREALWSRGQQSTDPYGYGYGYRRYRRTGTVDSEGAPVTRGAFPLRYDVVLPVAQWQPTWHHTFRYGGEPPALPIAWNAVDAAFLKGAPSVAAIRARVLPTGAPVDATLALCRGGAWTQERIDPSVLPAVQRLTLDSDSALPGVPCPTGPCLGADLGRLSLSRSIEDRAPILVLILSRGENYEVYRRRYDER